AATLGAPCVDISTYRVLGALEDLSSVFRRRRRTIRALIEKWHHAGVDGSGCRCTTLALRKLTRRAAQVGDAAADRALERHAIVRSDDLLQRSIARHQRRNERACFELALFVTGFERARDRILGVKYVIGECFDLLTELFVHFSRLFIAQS